MKGNTMENATASIFSCLTELEKKEALTKGSIAAMVANKRKELNMNQKDFAKHLNVSQGMISKWENLEYSFTISSLLELMNKLSVEVEILLDGKSITSSPSSTTLKKFRNDSLTNWKTNLPKTPSNIRSDGKGVA